MINNKEFYEIDKVKIEIKYEFFNKSDLRFILNNLQGRFKENNFLNIRYINENIKIIKLKKYAKFIEVTTNYSSYHDFCYYYITVNLNKKTAEKFPFSKSRKNLYNAEKLNGLIYIYPYPDIYI